MRQILHSTVYNANAKTVNILPRRTNKIDDNEAAVINRVNIFSSHLSYRIYTVTMRDDENATIA